MYRILIVATYDSFLKSAVRLAERIPHNGIDIAIHTIRKDQLSSRQIKESGAEDYIRLNLAELDDSDYAEYNLILLSVGNLFSVEFTKKFYRIFEGRCQRPLLITLFPGIIFGQPDTILSRLGSDLIIANSASDYKIIKEFINLYHLPTQTIHYGLINILNNFHCKPRTAAGKNIFFVDQVKVPFLRKEREKIVDSLLTLAYSRPLDKVFLKLRAIEDEVAVHFNHYPYSKILARKKLLPENFFIYTDSIEKAYSEMDLCLSVSSSCILEAAHYGIPAFIIKDLGIKESLQNHYFIGSDIFIGFDELNQSDEEKYQINPQWFENHIRFPENRDQLLLEHIEILIKNKRYPTALPKFQYRESSNKSTLLSKFRKLIRNPKAFVSDSKLMKLCRKLFKVIR